MAIQVVCDFFQEQVCIIVQTDLYEAGIWHLIFNRESCPLATDPNPDSWGEASLYILLLIHIMTSTMYDIDF